MNMKMSLLSLLLVVCVMAGSTNAGPYYEEEENENQMPVESDYSDDALENLMRAAQQKRGCIRRDGICDHRPDDCCYSSSCRCNLWGSNCRCQRMGLFQKWG